MKVRVIPIVVDALGLQRRERKEELEIRGTIWDHPDYGIVEIGQNTEKSARELEETCWHLNFCEKPTADAGVKNFQRVK